MSITWQHQSALAFLSITNHYDTAFAGSIGLNSMFSLVYSTFWFIKLGMVKIIANIKSKFLWLRQKMTKFDIKKMLKVPLRVNQVYLPINIFYTCYIVIDIDNGLMNMRNKIHQKWRCKLRTRKIGIFSMFCRTGVLP